MDIAALIASQMPNVIQVVIVLEMVYVEIVKIVMSTRRIFIKILFNTNK